MEMLDIVDSGDNVIGLVSKEDAYKKLLCHRISHVLIFNDEGKMALQLRSNNVSFCPNHWSTAVGGHVQAGETYKQAAAREYSEELGANSSIELVGKDFYQVPDSPDKFISVFKTSFNGPFRPDLGVVERVDFFSIDEITKMISEGEKFHPELLYILKKYFSI
ncbi:MAG: NUDIX domain-containing protein [Candidatus Magasanikbacteria bacterium]|nr:NUDIX domain-containing protein [Candidatus Magasanikbacteria bacterium]